MRTALRTCILLTAWTTGLLAAGFQPYPGSARQPDWEKKGHDAFVKVGPEKKLGPREYRIYSTNDSFDKVYAFYQKDGTEMKAFSYPKGHPGPNGTTVQMAAFSLDGQPSMTLSKEYIVITRPFFLDEEFKDKHDVTVITLTLKK